MRKTKEVLRLRFELGLGQRQIARCCGMGLGTVHEYLERATTAGIGWPLPEGLSEEELEAKLFGDQPIRAKAVERRPQPDWKTIHEQLQQHRHLTLQLVWEEYRQANPEGYRYSWFCERYQHWRRHLDVVLRQEHKAGEKMFIDWGGATIPVYDATTGQAWTASLFVAVLGASSYTYAEATRDQQLEAWIQAHIHALEFVGGVPTLAVPDNTKTAVTRACRYDPDLNHSLGAAVLCAAGGSRCGTGTPRRGVPVSERKVDLEERARRPSLVATAIQPSGLRGRHRLSGCTWAGQVGDACSGKRLSLGSQSRERFRPGTDRRGQELYRFGLGAESLSRRPLGSLSAGGSPAA